MTHPAGDNKLAEYFPYKTKGKRRVFSVAGGLAPEPEHEIAEQITLPGCESPYTLEYLLALIESTERARFSAELATLEARHEKLVALFTEAPTKLVRDSLTAEFRDLEARISSIKAGLTSYFSDYKAIIRQLVNHYHKAKEVRETMGEKTPAERREALRGLLHSITLSFRWVDYGTGRRSALASIEFEPQVGDSVEYSCTGCAESGTPHCVS